MDSRSVEIGIDGTSPDSIYIAPGTSIGLHTRGPMADRHDLLAWAVDGVVTGRGNATEVTLDAEGRHVVELLLDDEVADAVVVSVSPPIVRTRTFGSARPGSTDTVESMRTFGFQTQEALTWLAYCVHVPEPVSKSPHQVPAWTLQIVAPNGTVVAEDSPDGRTRDGRVEASHQPGTWRFEFTSQGVVEEAETTVGVRAAYAPPNPIVGHYAAGGWLSCESATANDGADRP